MLANLVDMRIDLKMELGRIHQKITKIDHSLEEFLRRQPGASPGRPALPHPGMEGSHETAYVHRQGTGGPQDLAVSEISEAGQLAIQEARLLAETQEAAKRRSHDDDATDDGGAVGDDGAPSEGDV